MLVVRIAKYHPLPDGNLRLGWQSLTMFRVLNGLNWRSQPTTQSTLMHAIAAGELI